MLSQAREHQGLLVTKTCSLTKLSLDSSEASSQLDFDFDLLNPVLAKKPVKSV